MSGPLRILARAGQAGRWLLVGGLVAGVLLPDIARSMRPFLEELVALLLFLAALRIGPDRALGAASGLGRTMGILILFQVALPLCAIAGFWATGMLGSPVALAVILLFSAAPLAGSPNLAILTGFDPAPALRLLILGTSLLPLTVLPVFWLLPAFGGVTGVLWPALRLLGVILLAAGAAFALRRLLSGRLGPEGTAALDGLSAIAMAVIVVALMSAVADTIATDPTSLAGWLALAFAVNLGPQVAVALAAPRGGPWRELLVPVSIVAGNRNIALFLVALPAATTDQLLVFIGCYQVPMYLTPLIMQGFFRWAVGRG